MFFVLLILLLTKPNMFFFSYENTKNCFSEQFSKIATKQTLIFSTFWLVNLNLGQILSLENSTVPPEVACLGFFFSRWKQIKS